MRSDSLNRWWVLLVPLMLLMGRPALAQKYVCMQSSQGEWCLELLRSVAPNTVTNLLNYVNSGGYTNSFIHRSVPGFVIQGGGFYIDSGNGINSVASLGTLRNEFNRSNLRGTVAMAQSTGPDSGTSQWYVNLTDNNFLDLPPTETNPTGHFTVFANVVYGMDIVDKIAALNVHDASGQLGGVFTQLPLVANQLTRQNLVLITNAYATDLLPGSTAQPYHCTAPVANDALTELCGSSVTFPVSLQGGGAYELVLDLIATKPTLVFSVRPGSLKPITNLPDTYATFNPQTNVAVIPSVRSGSVIYDNVQLRMTNAATLQFTLQSFTPR